MTSGVAVNGGWQNENFKFDIVDYAVFGAMLLLSALTGLYYGCRSRYCKTGEAPTLREYLTGSGNMKPFPVAMSLVASSLSVILNSTSMVILEDFVKGCMRMNLREKKATMFVKIVSLILGIVALGFVYIVERMGGVLAMATSLSAIAAGTTFGVFTLGMLVPWANSTGAIIGAIAGFLMSGWTSFGGQYAQAAGLIVARKLPVSVDYCEQNYGLFINASEPIYPDESHVFPLFRLSYHWITPIGVLTVLTVGSIVSLLTGKLDVRYMDPDLISPVLHRFLPSESFRYEGYAIRNARHADQRNCDESFKVKMTAFDLKEDSHRSLRSEER
ncbi:sodium-coupled monocarboxylate transporter [Holotrichia oblita]|uniref:Sodium-coupled monocarboxylate transporter n=1 Tax=Holotrichia oblita TaxID=644536 RepID=A0ACB9THM5_HOLOL|nr:sodium-coupled monocarboxylate transporter [Holotrichia oblita]